MNLSIATGRAVLTVLDGGHLRSKTSARRHREAPLPEETVHCTEKPWRSSWHERMDDDEKAFDEHAFGFDVPDAG